MVGAVDLHSQGRLEEAFFVGAGLGEFFRDGGDGAVVFGEAAAFGAGHVAFFGTDFRQLVEFVREGFSGESRAIILELFPGAACEDFVDFFFAVDVSELPQDVEGEGGVGLGEKGVGFFGEGVEEGGAADFPAFGAGLDEVFAEEDGELLAGGGGGGAAEAGDFGDVEGAVDLEQVEEGRAVGVGEFLHVRDCISRPAA